MTKALFLITGILTAACAMSQDLKTKDVPEGVKAALIKKFPQAAKVSWEKEKGNYEANWGGKSGEDHSAQFSPDGAFLELVDNIPVSMLPDAVVSYVKEHYHAGIREAGKVTNARGQQSYEAEIKGKDLLFDLNGNFMREDG